MVNKISYSDIDDATFRLDVMRSDYLRERGWKSSSSGIPGAFVLWTREWNGKPLMADTSLAVQMQRWIDPPPDDPFGEASHG
jgi:hypothetical protein